MDNKADKCNGISRGDTRQPIRRVTGHTLKDTGACDADWEFAICINENDIHELRKVFLCKINREKLTRFIDAVFLCKWSYKRYNEKSCMATKVKSLTPQASNGQYNACFDPTTQEMCIQNCIVVAC